MNIKTKSIINILVLSLIIFLCSSFWDKLEIPFKHDQSVGVLSELQYNNYGRKVVLIDDGTHTGTTTTIDDVSYQFVTISDITQTTSGGKIVFEDLQEFVGF